MVHFQSPVVFVFNLLGSRLSLFDQGQHVVGYLFPPVFRSDYQVAEAFPLTLAYLPTLIGLAIAELFEGKAAVFKFLRVHKVNVRAVPRILEPLGLFLDVHQYVLIEIRRAADLQLLNSGIKDPIYLLFRAFEEAARGGLQ